MKMNVDLRVGEVLNIGGAAIRLEKKSGQIARLLIEADPSIEIKNPSTARRSAPKPLEQVNG